MLTGAEKIGARRFCGYSASGAQAGRFVHAYGLMEHRLGNLEDAELAVIRNYLATLNQLEAAVQNASGKTHNAREPDDRFRMFDGWRRRLCGFLGLPPGPDLIDGQETTEFAPTVGALAGGRMIQMTLALVKRAAAERGHITAIKDLIRVRGLEVVAERVPTGLDLCRLYAEHEGKSFYQSLMESVLFGSVALALKGPDAVAVWRNMIGPTNPVQARVTRPMSLRAIFGREMPDNAVHGSDSVTSATREMSLIFPRLPLPEGNLLCRNDPRRAMQLREVPILPVSPAPI